MDFWTRPINPVVDGKKSYAIGLVSHRVDGYPYRVNFTLADLKLNVSYGYLLQVSYAILIEILNLHVVCDGKVLTRSTITFLLDTLI